MPRVTDSDPSYPFAAAHRHAPGFLPLGTLVSGCLQPWRCVPWIATGVMLGGLLLVASGCSDGPRSAPAPKSQADAPPPAPSRMDEPGERVIDFVLTDQDGQPFNAQALAGKVWVGSVFFANCPGPCFRENQALADLLREVDSPDLLVVSLTCDPENDTPDVLRRYAERFDADTSRWKFLTGDMETIKRIANESFRLPAEVGVHSERGVVFDRQGRLRGGFHLLQADRVDLLKNLVREVLDEPADEPLPATPDADTSSAATSPPEEPDR